MKGFSVIVIAALVTPVAALAADWTVYSYPEAGFSIQFPASPTVEKSTIRTSAGVSLPKTRYVVRQDRIVYQLDVVDYSSTDADATNTISETEKSFGAAGKVTVAIDARVNRSFGRELSVNGNDASRSAVAIFFVNKHLFTLVGQALAPNAIEKSGDAIRFQESLQFTGANGGFGGFGGFGGPGGGRFRGGNPQSFAACQGKSIGEKVQLNGPEGPVSATCTLFARPDAPPPAPAP
ncbi:MAG TPA: hypothetical protein VMC02_04545 [Steroidobacteraceae bacterium]|nr:hypothetical protein [Steroidobacteraceae bacterium]